MRQRVFGLNMLLVLLLNSGDLETAQNVAVEALDLSRQHQLDFMQQMTLGYYLPVFASQGKHEQAQAYIEEATRLAHRLGNPWMVAMACYLSGRIESFYENWSDAEVSYTEAAALFETVRDFRFAEMARSEVAHMKRKSGDLAGAEAMYQRTIVDFYEIGHTSAVAHQLECFGFIAESQHKHIRAAQLLGAAQALRQATDSTRLPEEQVEFERTLAHLAEALGEAGRDAALAEGQHLSIDEAVLLAIKK